MAHIRSSAKCTQIFKNIQAELLREWKTEEEEEEGSEDAEGVPGQSDAGHPTQVLQLVTTVETRWNTEYYMIER